MSAGDLAPNSRKESYTLGALETLTRIESGLSRNTDITWQRRSIFIQLFGELFRERLN
jgi:hypothetical protein